jgi:hypothetical protein
VTQRTGEVPGHLLESSDEARDLVAARVKLGVDQVATVADALEA